MSFIEKKKIIKYLCVYCGSAQNVDPIYHKAAADLGTLIGNNKLNLVYGGGRFGLMGILANAALEANAEVIGYIPTLLEELEGPHPGLTHKHIVDSMHTRKSRMENHADMFVALPGGFGTLDELFEIITWRQLNLHEKPIVVININGYWDPLKVLFNGIIDANFANEKHRNIVTFVDSVSDVLKFIY